MVPFSLHKLKRMMVARDGSVAVEFGLASIPLFILIIGLLEVSLMYASATVLEGGTVMASRLIRTGQTRGKQSWRDTVPARPFLGVTPQQAEDLSQKLVKSLLKAARA